MRRFWFGAAALIVTVGGAVTPAAAAASLPGAHVSANACRSGASRFKKLTANAASVNPDDPKSLPKVFRALENGFTTLASDGPKPLRSAFRDLADAYAPLVHINVSNPASLSQLETLATNARYRADVKKITQYFATQCHTTIPSPPGTP